MKEKTHTDMSIIMKFQHRRDKEGTVHGSGEYDRFPTEESGRQNRIRTGSQKTMEKGSHFQNSRRIFYSPDLSTSARVA